MAKRDFYIGIWIINLVGQLFCVFFLFYRLYIISSSLFQ